ncbi:MAG: HopJ type III effector protein [Oceanospirillaceae bacterium]|nr:HopJ type III effector protein [Oceanospirillaceae bacterium]MBT11651.1 HopJ type III effector protein [Oceanospirillaceae bacterium]
MSDFNQAKADFLQAIEQDTHRFADTLSFIDTWFEFTPTAFRNGNVSNSADQNQGSARVFALAERLALSTEQTLRCFGEHYRDVLATPQADNHHNLRRVQAEGLSNIEFDHFPLQARV